MHLYALVLNSTVEGEYTEETSLFPSRTSTRYITKVIPYSPGGRRILGPSERNTLVGHLSCSVAGQCFEREKHLTII